MSSGQKPRTPEFFPRMKVRGRARRRKAKVTTAYVDIVPSVTQFIKSMGEAGAAAMAAVGGMLSAVGFGMQCHIEQQSRLAFEYLLSERYQLDRIEREHRGDPIAHSSAVAEFFTRRAHQELDNLAQSILWDGAPALYAHLGTNFAPPSIVVKRGDVIGYIGGPPRGASASHIILDEARRLS